MSLPWQGAGGLTIVLDVPVGLMTTLSPEQGLLSVREGSLRGQAARDIRRHNGLICKETGQSPTRCPTPCGDRECRQDWVPQWRLSRLRRDRGVLHAGYKKCGDQMPKGTKDSVMGGDSDQTQH